MSPIETGYRSFPEFHEGTNALGFYMEVSPQIPRPREEVYFSRPVTGGFPRDLVPQMAMILEINRRLGEFVAANMESLFGEKQLTLPPSFLSEESEIITFWMYFISGLSVSDAEKFNNTIKPLVVDTRVLNNHRIARSSREQEYRRLLRGFTSFVENSGILLNPVSLLVLFPGHQYSLGCTLEKELAQHLGIPVKEAVFDQVHPDFHPNILQGILQPSISEQELWKPVDLDFPLPVIAGDGKSLITLRDL